MSTHKPNVLLITADHWFGSLLGCAGHPVIQTPTLDNLAECGTRFTRVYSECPVCIPARRTLMTGTSPRTHGDRVYKDTLVMPELPTLAGCFAQNGYQCYASGKLHVYPPRNRIGFHDVMLTEEGRYQFGSMDDYQIWLGEQGYLGKEYAHGLSCNGYEARAWHLPEAAHSTNWTTEQMCRLIQRRDPTRPAFYYLSFTAPHPPLVPPQAFLDKYDLDDIDDCRVGEWTETPIFPLRKSTQYGRRYSDLFARQARQAFYALCTHIDNQLRLVIGTLREAKMWDNTIVLFTSDHGDMLGEHRMWGKRLLYENSARVPFILAGKPLGSLTQGGTDDRLACLADIMPTLLNACGIEIPDTVEGLDMTSTRRRDSLYGEISEDAMATRMIIRGDFKLIYYAVGNHFQLFDLVKDPKELCNLAETPKYADIVAELKGLLRKELYGEDVNWLKDDRWIGLPNLPFESSGDFGFGGQRGLHWPPPL